MSKMNEKAIAEQNSTVELMKKRTDELAKVIIDLLNIPEIPDAIKNIKELCRRYADLEIDFNYVKELNTVMSCKYQELMDCFPTSEELQIVIDHKVSIQDVKPEDIKINQKRMQNLFKFKSALLSLEAQDHNKIPEKYEDLDKDGERSCL